MFLLLRDYIYYFLALFKIKNFRNKIAFISTLMALIALDGMVNGYRATCDCGTIEKIVFGSLPSFMTAYFYAIAFMFLLGTQQALKYAIASTVAFLFYEFAQIVIKDTYFDYYDLAAIFLGFLCFQLTLWLIGYKKSK